jgi:hypothetical protein
MWLKTYSDEYQPLDGVCDIGFTATCASTMRHIWMEMKGISDNKAADVIFKKWQSDASEGGATGITHNALDDSRFQAIMYHGMDRELKQIKCSM